MLSHCIVTLAAAKLQIIIEFCKEIEQLFVGVCQKLDLSYDIFAKGEFLDEISNGKAHGDSYYGNINCGAANSRQHVILRV